MPAHDGTNYGDALRAFQRTYFKCLLEWFHGEVAKVAIYAGVNRCYLYRLFRVLELNPREFRKTGRERIK